LRSLGREAEATAADAKAVELEAKKQQANSTLPEGENKSS
jgi:hypothetical protein